ncbi:MAG: type VI secretion system baseplate subunit TssE [Gammaproteobacteria bacterium]
MAERANPETLQPSLLDRLTDSAPTVQVEASDRAKLNVRGLRKAVMRDLAWLLNTGNLGSIVPLDDYDEVAASVLNFGMPDLAGLMLSSLDSRALQRTLRDTIARFEPRINPQTLKVTINTREDKMSRNALTLNIEGDLWSYPSPQRLFLATELDFESGDVVVRNASGRS